MTCDVEWRALVVVQLSVDVCPSRRLLATARLVSQQDAKCRCTFGPDWTRSEQCRQGATTLPVQAPRDAAGPGTYICKYFLLLSHMAQVALDPLRYSRGRYS